MKFFALLFSLMILSCSKEYSCEGDCLAPLTGLSLQPSPVQLYIACVGNSVTYGQRATTDSSYPAQLQKELNDSAIEGLVVNDGMLTGCSDSTLPNPGIKVGDINIAVVGEISQAPMDNLFDVTVVDYVADLADYCTHLREAGFRVIIMTIPYRRDYFAISSSAEIAFNGYLADINDSIRNEWPIFADGIADMKPLENGTYSQPDKLNFTAAGYGIMSGIVFKAIRKY
jgi:lysophospholipase L1-like esterase